MVDVCDGIIMSGGHHMYKFNEYVLKYAIDKDIPILESVGECPCLLILIIKLII